MPETIEQYKKRILSYTKSLDGALKVQKDTAKKIERLIKKVPKRKLMTRPGPGKWSVGEVLAHLAEGEMVGGYRLRMILSRNGTPIQAFDQDVWARNSDYARQDPEKSLRLFRALRESNLALLKSLPPKMWKYYGLHAERGKETIADVARMYAGHDVNHLAQIQSIIKTNGRG